MNKRPKLIPFFRNVLFPLTLTDNKHRFLFFEHLEKNLIQSNMHAVITLANQSVSFYGQFPGSVVRRGLGGIYFNV